MRSPIVDQKPGTLSHRVGLPASERPTASPWASASPQCSTRSGRPARGCGATATSPAAQTRGCELRRPASQCRPPVSGCSVSPAASASSSRGVTPAPRTTTSAAIAGPSPAVRTASAPSCARISRASVPIRSVTGAAASQPAIARPARSPSRSCCGCASPETSVTAQPIAAREAAASQPMKPEPIDHRPTRAAGHAGAERLGVVEAAQHEDPVEPDAGQRRPDRLRSGGQHARTEGEHAAVAERHPPGVGIELGHLAVAHGHGVLGEPAGRFEEQPVAVLPRAQVVLRQRGAPVGQVVLRRHERHGLAPAGRAVGADGRQARRAAADHDDGSLDGAHASPRRRSKSSR